MERNGRESRLAQAIATYLEKQVRGVRVLIVRLTPEGDGIKAEDLERLARVVEEEVSASRLFGDVWFGRRQGVLLRRRLELT